MQQIQRTTKDILHIQDLEEDSDQPPNANERSTGYDDYQTRLASFFNGSWPPDAPVDPIALASAGLYYIGIADKVQCFACKGKLFNWAEGDSPAKEHSRHFPKCSFVKNVLEQTAASNPPPDTGAQVPPAVVTQPPRDSQHQAARPPDEPTSWKSSSAVQAVLMMLYSEEIVKQAYDALIYHKGPSLSAEMLMDKVLEIEEQRDGTMQNLHPGVLARGRSQPGEESDITSENNQTGESEETQGAVGGSDITAEELQHQMENLGVVSPEELEEARIRDLAKRNEEMKSSTTCKICLDATVGVVFLPCKHLVCCQSCGEAVRKCPVCRTIIQATVKTFM